MLNRALTALCLYIIGLPATGYAVRAITVSASRR